MVDEIARWAAMDASERAQVMRELPDRLAACKGASPAKAMG